jgi:hypothetical protein
MAIRLGNNGKLLPIIASDNLFISPLMRRGTPSLSAHIQSRNWPIADGGWCRCCTNPAHSVVEGSGVGLIERNGARYGGCTQHAKPNVSIIDAFDWDLSDEWHNNDGCTALTNLFYTAKELFINTTLNRVWR